MIPWIQVYSNILTHDKTYALAEELKIPNYSAVGIMVSLWAWASINATDGDITNYPPRAIAEATGWTKKPSDFYNTLLKIRLIEKTDSGKIVIRNWEQYAILLMDLMESQKKKTNERVKRHRDRQKQKEKKQDTLDDEKAPDCNGEGNAPCNVTVTQCNALHNLTLPNPTIPDHSPSGENNNSFVVDDGCAAAPNDAEKIVDEFLVNRDLVLEQYFGATESTKAEVENITAQIFKRLTLRTPSEQDVYHVFEYVHVSEQLADSSWNISFPKDRIELLLYAFEQATKVGCPGNWNYIGGCMARMAKRGIKSLDDAENFDYSREYGGM